jgi:hypothetical protein
MGFGRCIFSRYRRRKADAAAMRLRGRRHVGISRWPEPVGGARERGCAPDPASSGQTVTCSGNTPAGFQAGGGVDNLTVNVLPGATVSDGGGGVIIGVNDFNTVTNSGTLSAGPTAPASSPA